MANRIDTWVKPMKAAHTQSLLDRPLPHPQRNQLPAGHHPMLPLGQLADSLIECTRLL